jgi:hypothetical protein
LTADTSKRARQDNPRNWTPATGRTAAINPAIPARRSGWSSTIRIRNLRLAQCPPL